MKDVFNELYNLIEADYECSEWAREHNFKKRINSFLEESEEIKDAIKNNDIENLKEELGDVLWDLIYTIYSGEKEELFKAEDIFKGIIKKIKRRKPWALEGKQVSKEEELKIWKEVKIKEKQGFYD